MDRSGITSLLTSGVKSVTYTIGIKAHSDAHVVSCSLSANILRRVVRLCLITWMISMILASFEKRHELNEYYTRVANFRQTQNGFFMSGLFVPIAVRCKWNCRMKREKSQNVKINESEKEKKEIFLLVSHRGACRGERSFRLLKLQRGSLWIGGGWWLGGSVGRLVSWLVGRGERASERGPLVKVPFTLMTKNRTSLNGTDEWLWKQHLICIEGTSLSTR